MSNTPPPQSESPKTAEVETIFPEKGPISGLIIDKLTELQDPTRTDQIDTLDQGTIQALAENLAALAETTIETETLIAHTNLLVGCCLEDLCIIHKVDPTEETPALARIKALSESFRHELVAAVGERVIALKTPQKKP
jgi:hypothetical protein